MDPGPPLRDIGCFTAVAQRLSFSRAAAGLGMSQPAVSQAVARLERALGLRLFERTSREVQLSDAGKVLLPLAEALLDQVAAFSAEAARLAVPSGPAIRLAYCPLVGGLAARVARRLARRSPARFRLPISHLAVPAGGPLAGATRLRLGQLARHDVLLPRLRPAGSVWARLAALLPEATTTTRSRATADDLDDLTAALDLVAAGQGLLPVPRLLAQTVLRPDIRFLPLDTGGLAMTYGLVWSPDRATAEVMALVQAVQQILRSPVQTGLR